MKILVNLLAVTAGGSLQNAANFWRAVANWGSDHEWLCVSRPGLGLEEQTTRQWQQLETTSPGNLAKRLGIENRWLPGLARKWGADVIFTLMGAGPLNSPAPTVVGWHDSTAAYPDSPFWKELSPVPRIRERSRLWYASLAVRRADVVCVQTEAMANRLSVHWRIPRDRFRIVANGPSSILADRAPRGDGDAVQQPWTVLVIGVPKPTKNFAVVPETGAHLRKAGVGPGRFVMTIESDYEQWLEPFRASLRRWGEPVPIERIGRVPHTDLGPLYRSADAVFLPSFLESFSATHIEAMHFGVPMVTSGYDFVREICGPAAEYVDPLDPADCARGLARVLTDAERRKELRGAGLERVRGFPTWKERFHLYQDACAEALRLAR